MVFFTCNNCGDSLKKKDCANHAGKCYPLALTCVDCHKDFFGNDFVAHTSCVTEAEKYGAKGFVSRAPSTTGATKQNEWTSAILSASKISDLTPPQRRFLGILSQHKNVPRKKKQFLNFARDVLKGSFRQMDVLDQIFGIMESEFQKIKPPQKGNNASEAKAEGNEEIKGKSVNNTADSVIDGTTNKKSEGKEVDESDVKAIGKDNIRDDGKDSISTRKKNQKKFKEDIIGDKNVLKENEIDSLSEKTSNDNIISKKSKKKKHKQQSAEAEEEVIKNENGTLEEPVNAEDDSAGAKSKKKKRKNAISEEEVIKNENDTLEEPVNAEDDCASAKSKKKKRKNATSEEEVMKNGNGTLEEPVNAEDDSASAKSKKKKKRKNAISEEEVMKNGNGTLEEPVNAEDDCASAKSKKKSKSKKDQAKVGENDSDDTVDLPKKSKKTKHKKCEENAIESLGKVNGHDETPAKDAGKKSKKKRLKVQEGEECVPKKKSKTMSG